MFIFFYSEVRYTTKDLTDLLLKDNEFCSIFINYFVTSNEKNLDSLLDCLYPFQFLTYAKTLIRFGFKSEENKIGEAKKVIIIIFIFIE